ncbi:MAG TPA: hypothetical protein VK348_15760 [Planctomycetota bacterium]|nr:hypothetical protein [Planctomycetota bacterium]
MFSCLGALVVLLPAAAPPAQEPLPQTFAERVRAGNDLVTLQWRRDRDGNLQCAPVGADDAAFQPLFEGGIASGIATSGAAGFMALVFPHRGDMLALTDGNAHLRRLGLGTADAEVRQFIATPLPAERPELAALDRMVAIDLLARRGARTAAAELRHLAEDASMPATLRRRAGEALHTLTGEGQAPPRASLDPATLPIPMLADGYLVVDHARMPDLQPVFPLARRLGLLAAARVLEHLADHSDHDLLVGQIESEGVVELPFELARQLGNHRIDRTFVAIQVASDDEVSWCCCSVGQFEPAVLASGLRLLPFDGVKGELVEQTAKITLPDGQATLTSSRLDANSGKYGGKPRPELAARLLDLGDAAVHVLVPAQSKAFLGLMTLGLPPAESADLKITFGDEFRLVITLKVRDEDAAATLVSKAKELQAQGVAMLRQQLTAAVAQTPAMAPLFAALEGARIDAMQSQVQATLTAKGVGWPQLEAMVLQLQHL